VLGLIHGEDFAGVGRVAADLDLPALLGVLNQGVGEAGPAARQAGEGVAHVHELGETLVGLGLAGA